MCRCPAARSNGAPAGSGGGDASAFSVDFDAPSDVVTSVRLVSLPTNGAWAQLRNVVVAAMFLAGGGIAAGDVLEQLEFPSQLATRSTTSGALTFGAPITPSPTVNDSGYQPPGPPAAAGIPASFGITANELRLNVGSTAVAGFVIRWRIRGQLWVYDGAARLVA